MRWCLWWHIRTLEACFFRRACSSGLFMLTWFFIKNIVYFLFLSYHGIMTPYLDSIRFLVFNTGRREVQKNSRDSVYWLLELVFVAQAYPHIGSHFPGWDVIFLKPFFWAWKMVEFQHNIPVGFWTGRLLSWSIAEGVLCFLHVPGGIQVSMIICSHFSCCIYTARIVYII